MLKEPEKSEGRTARKKGKKSAWLCHVIHVESAVAFLRWKKKKSQVKWRKLLLVKEVKLKRRQR